MADRLSGKTLRQSLPACEDPENDLFLSLASIWEIHIKSQLNRLTLRTPLPEMVARLIDEENLDLLPIDLFHIFGLEELPPIHGDPFDRLLASQARNEGARLVTKDAALREYPVETIW